jgi:type IV secretory pathway VirD2 relaxase
MLRIVEQATASNAPPPASLPPQAWLRHRQLPHRLTRLDGDATGPDLLDFGQHHLGILSPEFGERLELEKLTRDVMRRMSLDLGSPLEWVAVVHRNTDHPHIHVALRGIEANGAELRLPRKYVKSGLRAIAEEWATAQLGYRTEQDAVESFRRQVPLQRLTPLDRILNKEAASSERFVVRRDLDNPHLRGTAKLREQYLANRLRVLEGIGLARTVAPQMWEMRPDFLTVLRAMQQAGDRQKTLAAHGAQLSDDRLTMQVVDILGFREVEGRVVAYGENKRYTLVEGTDGQVHYFPQTSELEELRRTGGLSSNTFVRIEKVLGSDQRAVFEVQDLGDAEELLNNKQHFRSVARRLGQGAIPFDVGWKGWLGRYQKKAELAAEELSLWQEREEVRGGERGR